MSPSELREYLQVARDEGVTELRIGDFYVRMGPAPYVEEELPTPRNVPVAPKSLWENPSLWPGGKPPSFPTDR